MVDKSELSIPVDCDCIPVSIKSVDMNSVSLPQDDGRSRSVCVAPTSPIRGNTHILWPTSDRCKSAHGNICHIGCRQRPIVPEHGIPSPA